MAKSKLQNTNVANILQGKEAPNAVNAEKELLAAMLMDESAVPKVFEILKAKHFYDPKNQTIFEAMTILFEGSDPINITTVYHRLEKMNKLSESLNVGYLTELSISIASAVNAEINARIILEKWILRQIIESSLKMAQQAYSSQKDVFDILDEAESQIFAIAEEGLTEPYIGMDVAIPRALEYIESIHSKDLSSFSVKSGIHDLDTLLGGFHKSDLIIIAARPSMGKTAFAMSIARNASVDYNVPVAIFSLEMSTIQLITRLISSEARINVHNIRTGKFKAEEGQKISRTVHKLQQAKIFIDDTPAQTVLEIRAKARRMKREHKLGLIVIDYLQLMGSSFRMESREREISTISRSLKGLAKELDIPIIALAQLNRLVDSRQDKRPILSDLRESGSIEQDADVVMFLTRPEAYGITTLPNGESSDGYAEVIVAKQRNGPIGTVPVQFFKEYARFDNKLTNYQMPNQIESSTNEIQAPF